jgi:hypothetical protein
MNKISLTKLLTYSGSIPFILLTIIILSGKEYILQINITEALIFYSAIILSFISGIHFSYAILKNLSYKSILIVSVTIALFSWLSLLVNIKIGFIILIACYVINIIIDRFAYEKKFISKWFFELRRNISIIVILVLILNFSHISLNNI